MYRLIVFFFNKNNNSKKMEYKIIGKSRRGLFARTVYMDIFKTLKSAQEELIVLQKKNPFIDYEIVIYNNK